MHIILITPTKHKIILNIDNDNHWEGKNDEKTYVITRTNLKWETLSLVQMFNAIKHLLNQHQEALQAPQVMRTMPSNWEFRVGSIWIPARDSRNKTTVISQLFGLTKKPTKLDVSVRWPLTTPQTHSHENPSDLPPSSVQPHLSEVGTVISTPHYQTIMYQTLKFSAAIGISTWIFAFTGRSCAALIRKEPHVLATSITFAKYPALILGGITCALGTSYAWYTY